MKTSIIRSFLLFALFAGISTIVNAQTENTSERLIDQLKNGTAPGLLFSNERPAPPPATKIKLNEKESLITQIRKGTAPGMQFKPGSGGAPQPARVMARVAGAANKQLASDSKPAVVEKAKEAAPVIPKQE